MSQRVRVNIDKARLPGKRSYLVPDTDAGQPKHLLIGMLTFYEVIQAHGKIWQQRYHPVLCLSLPLGNLRVVLLLEVSEFLSSHTGLEVQLNH